LSLALFIISGSVLFLSAVISAWVSFELHAERIKATKTVIDKKLIDFFIDFIPFNIIGGYALQGRIGRHQAVCAVCVHYNTPIYFTILYYRIFPMSIAKKSLLVNAKCPLQ
jgi:hypothetical protein